MLERVGGFMCELGEIVRSSHESWDGRGYPDGLRGVSDPAGSAHRGSAATPSMR